MRWITGIGASKTDTIHSSTSVCCINPSTFETSILSKLTTYENIADQKWKHVNELTLADPEYWRNGTTDMILGANICEMIVLDSVIRVPMNTQIAIFGWILSGRINRAEEEEIVSLITNGCLSNQVETFWKVEELYGDETMSLTREEKLYEEFYQETVRHRW